ncbi:MAG: calcium-binding protein, partial [Thermodesulfobacteriota bacterium]
KSLVEQFISATGPVTWDALNEQILFKRTGSENIDPTSRGPNIDARKLDVLEKMFGESFLGTSGRNPTYEAAALLNESYRRVFELQRAQLMAQTHLKDLYDTITFTWDEESQELKIDTTALIAALDQAIADDPIQGKELLSEFARSRRGMGYFAENCFLSLREHFIQQDPSLGWIFDTGGLSVIEHTGQGTRPWSPHIEGTDNADAIRGSLTEGDGYLNGLAGNDVIYGTSRNEVLINETGDALLVAGAGNDTILAGAGNDILDGGQGSDTLRGETGNDTYILRVGSGRDTIIETDRTAGNVDAASGRSGHSAPFRHVSRCKHSIREVPRHGARRSGSFTLLPLPRSWGITPGAGSRAFRGPKGGLHRSGAARIMRIQPDGRFTLGQKFLEPISLVPFLSNRGSFGRLLLHAQ